jgi:murein DD-endopeptidase MepM/ murein hydrolase activator NlpD
MFNYVKVMVSIVMMNYSLCYGDCKIDPVFNHVIRTLTTEVNQHRLQLSTLSIAPHSLKEGRHRFVLSRLGLPLTTVSIAQTNSSEPKVTVVPITSKDNSSIKAKPFLPVEKITSTPIKFDWTMMPPVKAPISHQFGEGEKKLSRGIVYSIEASQTVHAPLAGEVIFAGPMKDFGYVIMIEKDFTNVILIAGIGHLDIKQGDKVYRGQKVGAVVKRSWVYLEFRNEGNPIDPQYVLTSRNVNEE